MNDEIFQTFMKKELTLLKDRLGHPDWNKRVDLLVEAATKHGWYPAQVDQQTYMIGFKREDDSYARINVYVTKSTFVTQINHPVKGRGQLFRRNIWEENYEKLFRNPRSHTGRGYYRRDQRR